MANKAHLPGSAGRKLVQSCDTNRKHNSLTAKSRGKQARGRISRASVLTGVFLWCLGVGGLAVAKGKPKPGPDPPPTPSGTLYVIADTTDEAGGAAGFSMDANAGNRVGVPIGNPTYETYGGERWYIDYGEVGPDQDIQLIARNGSGAEIQLTSTDLYIFRTNHPPRFVGNDGTHVSFIAMDSDFNNHGIYVVELDYSSGNPVAVGAPWRVLPVGAVGDDVPLPDVGSFSWSDDATILVHDAISSNDIEVVDFMFQTSATYTVGFGATVAPDGTAVAYIGATNHSLMVMEIDGSNQVELYAGGTKGKWDHFNSFPEWSPDSQHIAWTHRRDDRQWGDLWDDLFRISRSGGDVVDLGAWSQGRGITMQAWR